MGGGPLGGCLMCACGMPSAIPVSVAAGKGPRAAAMPLTSCDIFSSAAAPAGAEDRGQRIGYLAGNGRNRLRRGVERLSGGIGLLQSRGDRLLGVGRWRGLSRPGWRFGGFWACLSLATLLNR